MKNSFCLFAFTGLLLIACKSDTKPPETALSIGSYTIEQFMDNENVYDNGFSFDNSKVLMTSNRTGIYNIYTVPAEGGDFTPITQSDSASIRGISYFPEDDRILFMMDGNGDEIWKIYLKDSTGIKSLTPPTEVRATFSKWSKDGKSFFYRSNQRDPKFMDYYEMSLSDFKPELVYKVEDDLDFRSISDDKKYIVLSKAINTNDSDLYVLNTETKEKVKINENQSGNSFEDFSPDNQWLYYTTDDGSEFSYVMRYDPATGEKEKIKAADWDISSYYFSFNGKYQITLINEDASNKAEIVNTATGEELTLPVVENEQLLYAGFSRDETMALLDYGGSNSPSNVYSYNLESEELHKLTNVLNSEIDPNDLVSAEVIRYKSFDELEIPAIYYLPKQASASNKVPALVWVHGGPGGQSRTNFSSVIQYLVNHGYAVLAVNNRGSSGYGKSFYQMDDLNHGDKDLKDCIAGKDWLAGQEAIDSSKIGILGGSYGGYMTMAALTYAPEDFAVGVNLFGVTNWIRTLRSIPPWWESQKEALYKELGDPNSADSVRLRAISPLFHTDKVTKPLIVLQGAKDPRVLQVESDEIVEGIRSNGVPVEYVLFEDEGHGFVKKENQIEAYESILLFLDKYLKDKNNDPDMEVSSELPTQ